MTASDQWVRVPREPTEEMVEAGRKAMSPETFVSHARVLWTWDAMLAAAPAAPAPVDWRETAAKVADDRAAREEAYAREKANPSVELHALRVAVWGTAKSIAAAIRAIPLPVPPAGEDIDETAQAIAQEGGTWTYGDWRDAIATALRARDAKWERRIKANEEERDAATLEASLSAFDLDVRTTERDESDARADAAEAQVKTLREALEAYHNAAQIDALMEGPRLRGFNLSALRRAYPLGVAALAPKEPKP